MQTLTTPSLGQMGLGGSVAIQPGFENGLASHPPLVSGIPDRYDGETPMISLKGAGNVSHMNTTMTYKFEVALAGKNVGHDFIMQHDLVLGRSHRMPHSGRDCWELRSLPYMNYMLRWGGTVEDRMTKYKACDVVKRWHVLGTSITQGRQPDDGVTPVTLETRGWTRVNNLWTLSTRASAAESRYMPQAGWHLFLYLRRIRKLSATELTEQARKQKLRKRPAPAAARPVTQEEDDDDESPDNRPKAGTEMNRDELRGRDRQRVGGKHDDDVEWYWAFEPRVYSSHNPPFIWSDYNALIHIGCIKNEQRSGLFSDKAVQELVNPPSNFPDAFNPKAKDRLSQFIMQLDPYVIHQPALLADLNAMMQRMMVEEQNKDKDREEKEDDE